jgi:hypothetical protein
MRKSELIAALNLIPGDPLVVVDGYEDGFDHTDVRLGRVLSYSRRPEWSGLFFEDNDGVPAVLITATDGPPLEP